MAAAPTTGQLGWQIVLAAAALTMTVGNVMALWQDNLRRLLAYSSIAQAGYMLIALAVGLADGSSSTTWNGTSAVGFYLLTYAVATIGAFAVLEHLGRSDRSLDGVDELAGLGATRPAAATLLTVCLFSLTGIPPMAGFWGKLLVFGGALAVDPPGTVWFRWCFVGTAVLGVLNAAVAAAYYLRIIAVMYFRTPLATPRAQGGAGPWWAAVVCALVLLGVGVYPGMLIRETNHVANFQPQKEKPPLQSAPRPGAAATTVGHECGNLSRLYSDGIIIGIGDNTMSPCCTLAHACEIIHH
jgi:NADH-quinone oxidoreductase subunit N